MKSIARFALILVAVSFLGGCGYNTLQAKDETVKEAWAKVLTAYKKRHDLVPNLLGAAEKYAAHEKETFMKVTQARALASQPMPDNPTQEQVNEFEKRQRELSASISQLRVTVESYPQLKADQGFLKLQDELVNAENQIAASRNVYAREVRAYNVVVRSFPSNLTAKLFGNPLKPQLEEDNKAIMEAPVIR